MSAGVAPEINMRTSLRRPWHGTNYEPTFTRFHAFPGNFGRIVLTPSDNLGLGPEVQHITATHHLKSGVSVTLHEVLIRLTV